MKKNTNSERTNENNSKYIDMMCILKAMKHNEATIERLQMRIMSIKDANAKLAESFKALVDKE